MFIVILNEVKDVVKERKYGKATNILNVHCHPERSEGYELCKEIPIYIKADAQCEILFPVFYFFIQCSIKRNKAL